MAVEKHNPLADARIDEHPLGTPTANDMFIFRDLDDGITKAVLAANVIPQAPVQSFKWVPDKQPAYGLGEMVTYNGVWYESKAADNTGVPGIAGTWQAYNAGAANGGFYRPGVYSAPNVAVYSNHNGTTEIYELAQDVPRPFNSVNIALEEQQGKWISIMGQLRRIHVAPVGGQLTLDCKHLSQVVFIVDGSISDNTLIVFQNHERIVWFKIRFTIGAPLSLTFPENTISSDPLFNENGDFKKRFIDRGTYSIEGTYDEENFWIETYGPGRGTSNNAPALLNHSIALVGDTLVATRTYYDPEGDLENNPPPYITNLLMSGDPYPGSLLTITYTFNSPMNYAEGPPLIQWYRMNEDFTNITEIPGANELTYIPQFDDKGYWVFARIRVTQTAPPPANGNPTSNEWSTNALMIEEEVVGVAPLVLEDYYDNIMNLYDDNYDAVNFRVADTGLWSGAAYWTSPDANSRPTYDAANKRLRFDPSVTVRYIDAPIAASNSKGSSGTRRYEYIGVFELNSLPAGADEFAIWSILTSYLFKMKSDTFLHYQSSTGAHFPFALQTGVKYRFRLRTDINAVSGFIEARLQLNFDENTETFAYDGTIQGTNGGAGIGAGSTMRLGASKNVPPIDEFDGWWYEFALLGQSHVDAQYELNLWRRLNLVAGL